MENINRLINSGLLNMHFKIERVYCKYCALFSDSTKIDKVDKVVKIPQHVIYKSF